MDAYAVTTDSRSSLIMAIDGNTLYFDTSACICYPGSRLKTTEFAMACTQPFQISAVLPCLFFLVTVEDVTITTAEMTSGTAFYSIVSTAVMTEPTCVMDITTVDSGCYSEFSSGVPSSSILS
jgi:hypothetical protein